MKTRRSMLAALAALGAVLCVDVGVVHAGLKTLSGSTVTIYTSSRWAYGSLGLVRNTSDSTQYVGCRVTSYLLSSGSPWTYANCYARNTGGTYASCITYNAKLIEIAEHLPSDGRLDFWWDASGNCTEIDIDNGSWFAPKQP